MSDEHYHYTISQGSYSDYDEAWVVGTEAITEDEFRQLVKAAVLLVAESRASRRGYVSWYFSTDEVANELCALDPRFTVLETQAVVHMGDYDMRYFATGDKP
jgi:hypothetical protein